MPEAKPTKVLFLVPYPVGYAPSQRFRVENFLFLLDDAGIGYQIAPFMDEQTWRILFKPGHVVQKVLGTVKGFLRRAATVLFQARKYDYVFVHREAAPLGPPVFEWFLAKVLRKKVIYDFDDAIWISNAAAGKAAVLLKAAWKVGTLMKYTYKVSGGNDYLCDFARSKGAQRVVRIPTVVDTEHRYNVTKPQEKSHPAIGWTGSHSTLKYLNELMPVLQRLQEKHRFTFIVIADKQPELPLADWQFLHWNSQTEIEDLLKIDIGVMPLLHDPWSEGKCGFKIIQYLSLGIPAVASPVGVNGKIVDDGQNGFLCATAGDWETALERLLTDAALRKKMGAEGQEKMVQQYSIASQSAAFVQLFS